ncbi:MAG: glycerate kinase [Planctomycetota bacterium]
MPRSSARTIWNAAVDAVRPAILFRDQAATWAELRSAPRILVLGAGKAGAAMSVAFENALGDDLEKVTGWVNIPEGTQQTTRRIHLHPARPLASNHPMEAGVAGSREILRLAREAGPDDVAVCLWSGGGSALLPAPVAGITLADKQAVTKLLHACGATINEMNAVRKHLSAIKGGRLAEAFAGRRLISLVISDVVGDPLDVIASGPTAPDPTTFADVWAILERFDLISRIPAAVAQHLRRGCASEITETPKAIAPRVTNQILGNNALALQAAAATAARLGYRVVNLGSFIEGETSAVATAFAGIVTSVRRDNVPHAPPVCILSGGETTVTLPESHGRGGRNQEFALAMLDKLSPDGLSGVAIVCGGTDGEDGPTDAAGALVDVSSFARAAALGLSPRESLLRHDAYPFFQALGDLVITGPTGTNVMDIRVMLIDNP